MFKWDFSSIQDKIDNEREDSKLYSFRINVEAGYDDCGRGMPADRMDRYDMQIKQAFYYDEVIKDDLLSSISHIDKNIRKNTTVGRDWDGSSLEIKYNKGYQGYCYAHPSQWSGYGTKEFISALEQALKDMMAKKEPIVTSYNIFENEQLLPLRFETYQKLLADNTEGLIKFFEEECVKQRIIPSEVGFEFARKYRPDNLLMQYNHSVGGGLAFNDPDVAFVNNLYKSYQIMKDMGIVDYSKYVEKDKNDDLER